MTQYTWCASLLLAGCAASMTVLPSLPAAAAPSRRRAPVDDSAAMATGYIYRKDGNKPALFLKLGAGAGQSEPQVGVPNPGDTYRGPSASRFDKSPYRRPQQSQDYRLAKQEGYDGHIGSGFQPFGPGGALDVPNLGAGSDDTPGGYTPGGYTPGGYSPDHNDPQAGILDNGHYNPESGLEDNFDGVDDGDSKRGPSYLGSAGPLDGLGDVGDEYLAVHGSSDHFAPLKATRSKHNARHHDSDDEFGAIKSVGDEYISPLKHNDEYTAGSHADYHHHGWSGHGGGKNFAKGGGSKHSAHHYSIHGNKAGKGHKNTKTFGAGEHGVHGGEAHKKHFAGHGQSKKVHHDEGAKFGSHHSGTKGSSGNKHGEKGHGKKGHKSTGFHNVYNKDEFKKDTAFYDSNDKGGHHHKGGDHASQHSGKSGAHKKGGFVGAGYVEGHKDKTSHVDKGKVSKDHKSNKGAAGHDAHFAHKETFGKKDGFSSGKKFSHSSKGGH